MGKLVNIMAADALAPFVARASAAMVLTVFDQQVHDFHEEGSELPVASQCKEMIRNANKFLCFLKQIQPFKGLVWAETMV